MATISRTGIAGGGTISPAHITNIIDALDGSSSTTTVVASGSFSGSLTGHATSATSASYAATASYVAYASSFPFTGSAIISGSLLITGSLNVSGGITGSLLGSASYATTASFALNAGGGGSSFPFTGSAIISGSLLITGSLNVSAGIATPQFTINAANTASAGQHLVLDLNLIAKSGGTGQFIIPSVIPSAAPKAGTMYFDDAAGVLYIYSVSLSGWQQFVP